MLDLYEGILVEFSERSASPWQSVRGLHVRRRVSSDELVAWKREERKKPAYRARTREWNRTSAARRRASGKSAEYQRRWRAERKAKGV